MPRRNPPSEAFDKFTDAQPALVVPQEIFNKITSKDAIGVTVEHQDLNELLLNLAYKANWKEPYMSVLRRFQALPTADNISVVLDGTVISDFIAEHEHMHAYMHALVGGGRGSKFRFSFATDQYIRETFPQLIGQWDVLVTGYAGSNEANLTAIEETVVRLLLWLEYEGTRSHTYFVKLQIAPWYDVRTFRTFVTSLGFTTPTELITAVQKYRKAHN